ncbi:hypothetical protein CRG98_029307 [Punica granatum]|uniref:AB hydrolase-1 domain-containing protein n=2 Tax=Punica granatum TaxID=22663 RepID=A0A2I0J1X4_PUNGR|nr:hypothetical protein CRG98_029307 [Punica granatum]
MERMLYDFLKKPILPFFLLVLLLSLAHGASPKTLEPTPSTRHHFVLVHGSCHGEWSWYKLVRLLRSSGHEVMALDLAASGVDQRQASSLKSISDYFQPLMELMASLNSSQRVLLVGQSMGGLAISQAMERFPRKISVAVFVTATMPGPSLSVSISIMRDPFFSYWFRFSGSSMLRISI